MDRHNEDVRYIVNEEKRTVVAILTVPIDEVCREIRHIINKSSYPCFVLQPLIPDNKILLTGEYIGKAKAHPDDVWDVKEGKKKAFLRARRRYMQERAKIFAELDVICDDIKRRFGESQAYTMNSLAVIARDLND
jgi:hypothetical protein